MLKKQNFDPKVMNYQVLKHKNLVSPNNCCTFARHYNFRGIASSVLPTLLLYNKLNIYLK